MPEFRVRPTNPPHRDFEFKLSSDYLKTVRHSEVHFSFFLLPVSFFSGGRKKALVKKEEGRGKKEE
jgi:hypothetical protein